jgi:hypothetical protein
MAHAKREKKLYRLFGQKSIFPFSPEEMRPGSTPGVNFALGLTFAGLAAFAAWRLVEYRQTIVRKKGWVSAEH